MEHLAGRVVGAIFALAAVASAQSSVWVVDSALGPGADFATIQQAVAVACCGDTILVRPSATPYATFYVDNRSLSIVADGPPPGVLISGGARVANLAANQTVVLVGLTIEGFGLAPPAPQFAGNGLRLFSNAGRVRVENCVLRGADGDPSTVLGGWVGVYVNDSGNVVFERCTIEGGDGYSVPFSPSCAATGGIPPVLGGAGGDGLQVWVTSAAVYASDLRGGRGGDGCPNGAPGGIGMTLLGASGSAKLAFAGGSSFTGGDGGDPNAPSGDGGAGGEGITSSALYTIELLDAELAGGLSGGPSPVPAAPFVPGSADVVLHDGAARWMDAAVPVRESTGFALTLNGAPGDLCFVLASGTDAFTHLGVWKGLLLLASPQVFAFGFLGPTGTKNSVVPVGPLFSPSLEMASVVLQMAVLDASFGIVLGSGLHQVILDASL